MPGGLIKGEGLPVLKFARDGNRFREKEYDQGELVKHVKRYLPRNLGND